MKTYRVESNFSFIHNKQGGIGPYSAKSSITNKTKDISKFLLVNGLFNYEPESSTSESHPTPENDNILDFDHNFYFSFESIEALKKWFDKFQCAKLKRAGFYVAIYEAPDVILGEQQMVFDKRTAYLVEFVSLTEI